MAKRQKLTTLQIEDLPNEMIVQVLCNLDIKDLTNCGMVSKRFRAIYRDESLWEKIRIFNKIVPMEFVQLVVNSGCKYLSLLHAKMVQGKSSEFQLAERSKLKYLQMTDFESMLNESLDTLHYDIMEKILASCYSLEKLSLKHVTLTPSMIKSICMQNGQTLQSLSLEDCKGTDIGCIKQIFEKCTKLEELQLKFPHKSHASAEKVLNHLAQNLPPKIEKLDLGGNYISDQFLDTLIPRCTNLKSLALTYVKGISNRSVTTITHYLKDSLEELDLNVIPEFDSYVTLEKLKELRSMSKLKILICNHQFTVEEMMTLRKNVSQVKKVKSKWLLNIAHPERGFWLNNTKELKMFKENWNL